MKLEEGKRYVTRGGDITEPLEVVTPPYEGATFKAVVGEGGPTVYWYSQGWHMPRGEPHGRDILAIYTEPQERASEEVNHPARYNASGIECIDAIEAALTPEEFRGFIKGNVLKYVWREKHKAGDQDLAKATWYLNRLTR